MQKFETLSDAIRLAEFAHNGQVDKAGLPYIEHPKRVLATVQGQGALPYVQIAAVLHDVTEDTRFTPAILHSLGFSEAAVRLVALLDRHESRDAWLLSGEGNTVSQEEFYYDNINDDPSARMIKLADIADNTQPWRLAYLEPETRVRLANKYSLALQLLDVPVPGW